MSRVHGPTTFRSMAVTDPFAPTRLGPVELRNHVIKAATFEGMSRKNVVSDSLVEFHRRIAAGGVAMTTVSYVAVSRDAMGAPGEIYIHDAAGEGLAHIASVVHAEGARIAAQLGHAGAVGVMPGKTRGGTVQGTHFDGNTRRGDLERRHRRGGCELRGRRSPARGGGFRFPRAPLRASLPDICVPESKVEQEERRVRGLDREQIANCGRGYSAQFVTRSAIRWRSPRR